MKIQERVQQHLRVVLTKPQHPVTGMAHEPTTALLTGLVLRAAGMVMVDNETALKPAYGAQTVLGVHQRQPFSTRQFVMGTQILTS